MATRWYFVVDTDQYSGNFKREMGAYLTGIVGEYFSSTAEALARLYREETGDGADEDDETQFAEMVTDHDTDGLCGSSYTSWVGIWPTPGWFNNGRGKHYREDDPAGSKVQHRWPAYQSVAIAFDRKPTPDQLRLLHGRAKAFPVAFRRVRDWGPREQITVMGCRLIKESTRRKLIEKTIVESAP